MFDVGDDVGVVNTAIEPGVVVMGSRIEDDRDYGGCSVLVFDELFEVGLVVVQLVGSCDAVVVDRLDDWAQCLV